MFMDNIEHLIFDYFKNSKGFLQYMAMRLVCKKWKSIIDKNIFAFSGFTKRVTTDIVYSSNYFSDKFVFIIQKDGHYGVYLCATETLIYLSADSVKLENILKPMNGDNCTEVNIEVEVSYFRDILQTQDSDACLKIFGIKPNNYIVFKSIIALGSCEKCISISFSN